ncbi:LytR/AlgR family response regulator transcription factor [Neolewinella persica]|uniref:LytR/AlgR family response regulator transcription factor n=1 Tax=Neolewinella persica TaxID=70998 RepID=UPI00036084E6|nr:LytTR family DNA-binding domain-containing protein [Neolewinella persica]
MISQSIKSIIVDDEANGRENINILLKEFCPEVEIIGVASNLREAENLIKGKRPELVFLDIQLGAETAFTLLNRLNTIDFEIIFVTAHDHFALRAFEFMAVDYLLKPIEIDKLRNAVTHAVSRIGQKSLHLSMEEMMMHVQNFNRGQHKIALATQNGYEMVYIKDIMYCTADGSYTHFHFVSGDVLIVSKNLKYYENLLKGYSFIRGHNTALVNLRFIKRIDRTGGGSIVMEDDKALPVAKAKRLELESRIKENRRLF